MNKKLLTLAFVLTAVPCFSQNSQALEECNAKGKNYFEYFWYEDAEKTFKTCLKMNPKDTDTLINLAGALLIQNKYKEAKPHLEAALNRLDKNSPYLSYCYSRLGDIAIEEQDFATAAKYYDFSLSYNKANVNSIIGKGVVYEEEGLAHKAAEMYTLALDLSPHEVIARDKLRALEPKVLTDAEILQALKERKAVDPKTPKLSPEQKQLFKNIHRSEMRGDIEFLLKEKPSTPNLVIIKDKDKSSYRAMFTLDGFITAQQLIGADAKAFFVKLPGVDSSNVIHLKALDGQNIFTPEGMLTEEGRYAYDAALQGKKAFLFPNEKGAETDSFKKKLAEHTKRIESQGYIQISAGEYKFLKDRTLCSDVTMQRDLNVFFWYATPGDTRYFIRRPSNANIKGNCGANKYAFLYEYINSYRQDPSSQPMPSGQNFFGTYGGALTICDTDGDFVCHTMQN